MERPMGSMYMGIFPRALTAKIYDDVTNKSCVFGVRNRQEILPSILCMSH